MGLLPFEQRKYTILIKKESDTNPAYGKRPEDRTVEELIQNGVICLNKPQGPTSHQVADYAKKIANAEKSGHSGSLDPNVTGVLPIALNKGTRVMDVLLKAGKEYVCWMHLHKPVEKATLQKVLQEFTGKITQLPPRKSAVKRQERERKVYYLDILESDEQDVLFTMGCQAGTYVRKVCHDVGKKLGVGAHMQQLVRTKAGPFHDKEWYSLQDMKDALTWYKEGNEKEIRKIIKPIEFAVTHLPKVWIFDEAVDTVCHGANLSIPGIAKYESDIKVTDIVAVFSLKGELVAIGEAMLDAETIEKNEKGMAIKAKKVFMNPETYPHFKKQD